MITLPTINLLLSIFSILLHIHQSTIAINLINLLLSGPQATLNINAASISITHKPRLNINPLAPALSIYFHYLQLTYQPHLCINGSVQDCSISIANALEILQSCTKPSICNHRNFFFCNLLPQYLDTDHKRRPIQRNPHAATLARNLHMLIDDLPHRQLVVEGVNEVVLRQVIHVSRWHVIWK